MSSFRGSDESLEREIATLEKIGRLRTRRVASELRQIERDLHELRRERARRRAEAAGSADPTAAAEEASG